MQKTWRNKTFALLVLFFIIPQIALAAWWNPFSWKIFSKSNKPSAQPVVQVQPPITDIPNAPIPETSTTKSEIAELREQLRLEAEKREALEKKIQNTQPKNISVKVNPPSPKETAKTFTLSNGTVVDETGKVISSPNQISPPPASNAETKTLTSEEIFSLISPTIVYITNSKGHGTGFVIGDGRYTITNAHVVGFDPTVQVRLYEGTTFTGTVLGRDTEKDVALIYNGKRRPTSVKFGKTDTESLRTGGEVYALGFPLDYTQVVTLTKGIVSANRQQTEAGVFIQTDATIHPGNSGGPLVNNKGEVIGINSMVLAIKLGNDSIGGTGLGFAIPIETVIDLIPRLSNYGKSRVEVYPVGSSFNIKRTMATRIEYNRGSPCEGMGFIGNELILCDLYNNYMKDYEWNIIPD